MGADEHKESSDEKKSNSSVLNLSLESMTSKKDDDSYSNLSDIKKEVILPIENENLEPSEIILEENDIHLKIFAEEDNKIDDCDNDGYIVKKRSKSFAPNISYKNAPKPHLKISNEYISPLKLNLRSFGNFSSLNKRPNQILFDFQKNIIDCKSCNDEENQDYDLFLLNSETERTTPNIEDLQDLLNCRKKMTIFRNSINDRTVKEYENILNSDYLFIEKDSDKNINTHHHKKNKFWHKHIKQQQLKYSNKMFSAHFSMLPSCDCDDTLKRSDTVNNEKIIDNEGLFILGILESAANEKKGRNTVNV
jgi:hypothetical protein